MSTFDVQVVSKAEPTAKAERWAATLQAEGLDVTFTDGVVDDGPAVLVVPRSEGDQLATLAPNHPTLVVTTWVPTTELHPNLVLIHERLSQFEASCLAKLTSADLIRMLRHRGPRGEMLQIGPSTNGFLAYDIEDDSGTIGQLIATGWCPLGTNVAPYEAAWSWTDPPADFPERFALHLTSPDRANAKDDAWRFEEGPFPEVADPVDPTGFTAHAIARRATGPTFGHLFNRTGEQFWSCTDGELDSNRRFRNRRDLYFQVESSPAAEPLRVVTTLRDPAAP
ncbi:MAG: hypothetical protein ABMA64_31395 [Myxococcota bacterium]